MIERLSRPDRSIILRVLILILAILVMMMTPLCNFGEAHAIAITLTTAGVVVIIGSILVAGGLIVATQEQLRQIAQGVWADIQSMGDGAELLIAELVAINKAVFAAQSQGITAAIHVSARLWDAIFSKFVTDKVTVDSSTGDVVIQDYTGRVLDLSESFQDRGMQPIISDADGRNYVFSYSAVTLLGTTSTSNIYGCTLYCYRDGELILSYDDSANSSKDLDTFVASIRPFGFYKPANKPYINFGFFPFGQSDHTRVDMTFPITLGVQSSITASGSIALPAPDTLVKVPDLPTQDDKGEIAWPDIPLLPEDARIHDIPDAAGDLTIPDIPYDKVIDAATGAVVGDVVVPDVPDVPTTEVGWLAKIGDAISSFFDSPSDFKLNFDKFKTCILPDRFPFCIPFDFVNSVRIFSQQAKDYKLSIDLDTQFFAVHQVIDLSPYAVPIAFFRYVAVIWFAVGLITRTRDLMKW